MAHLRLNGDFGEVTDEIGYYEFENVYDANQIQELRCISYHARLWRLAADDLHVSEWTPLSSVDPISVCKRQRVILIIG